MEAVSGVYDNNKSLIGSHAGALEHNKKIFVRVSKSFSETLKRFFKDGKWVALVAPSSRPDLPSPCMRSDASHVQLGGGT